MTRTLLAALVVGFASAQARPQRHVVVSLKPICEREALILELTETVPREVKTCVGPVRVGFACASGACSGEARVLRTDVVVAFSSSGGAWSSEPGGELTVTVLGESGRDATPRSLRVSLVVAGAQASMLVPPGEVWAARLAGCRQPLLLSHRLNAAGAIELLVLQGKRAPLVTETDLGREVVLVDGCRRSISAKLELP